MVCTGADPGRTGSDRAQARLNDGKQETRLEDLHDRYLTGPSGLFQRIEVKVAQPKGNRLSVYARHGYRMP
jgi:hypothetical protein